VITQAAQPPVRLPYVSLISRFTVSGGVAVAISGMDLLRMGQLNR